MGTTCNGGAAYGLGLQGDVQLTANYMLGAHVARVHHLSVANLYSSFHFSAVISSPSPFLAICLTTILNQISKPR